MVTKLGNEILQDRCCIYRFICSHFAVHVHFYVNCSPPIKFCVFSLDKNMSHDSKFEVGNQTIMVIQFDISVLLIFQQEKTWKNIRFNCYDLIIDSTIKSSYCLSQSYLFLFLFFASDHAMTTGCFVFSILKHMFFNN